MHFLPAVKAEHVAIAGIGLGNNRREIAILLRDQLIDPPTVLSGILGNDDIQAVVAIRPHAESHAATRHDLGPDWQAARCILRRRRLLEVHCSALFGGSVPGTLSG